ncbi:hypothetical protein IFU24_22770 [Erwinia persicina]|nr:hypothetical protein [Erwinia persicina]
MDRPDVYKQAANELWLHGKTKIGILDISPGDGCRHPKGSFYSGSSERISGLDWITLASLRDSENSIMSYDEVGDQVAGITMWGKLIEWFEKAGYEKVFDNISLSHADVTDVIKLNSYVNQGCRVVTLVSAGMLSDYPGDSSAKNHWIVWESQVENNNGEVISKTASEDEKVNLRLFSWGGVGNQLKTHVNLNIFMKHTFGGLVFRPIK